MQKEILEKAIKSVQTALEIKKRADALATAVKLAAAKAEKERLAKLKIIQEAEEKAERERLSKVQEAINASFGEAKYKVLQKDDQKEVRLYRPCKRTINISGHDYFLPFPYMFFKRAVERRMSNYNVGNIHACLYVGFTTVEAKEVYIPPFGGFSGYLVCLDGNYHYDWPVKTTIESMISTFWATQFPNSLDHYYLVVGPGEKVPFNGRYHDWQKMDYEQVQKEVNLLTQKISFETFLRYQRL